MPVMNKCKQCGAECPRTYCGKACANLGSRTGSNETCEQCGGAFYRSASEKKRHGARFCSIPCRRTHGRANATVYLRIGRKYVHRIVAEQKLGRSLAPGEVVHHLDGNILNNDPDNLVVCQSQAEHVRREIAEGKRVYTHEAAVERGKLSGAARRKKRATRSHQKAPYPAS